MRDRHATQTELLWVLLEERKEVGEGKREKGGREREREHRPLLGREGGRERKRVKDRDRERKKRKKRKKREE